MPRPNASQAIGLQFDSDANSVGVSFAARRVLRLLRTRQNPQQILHVMADQTRYHIGFRKLAGPAAAAAETRF